MILKKLLYIWLNKYIKHTIKLRTFKIYESIIEKHIAPLLGDYDLINLSTSIIQDFIIFKAEQGSLLNKQKLSYNTVNLITSVLKQALKYAFKIDLIPKDITINISLPKQKEKRIQIFDEKEQYLLESFCLSKKSNYIGIVICLYTGLRIGELLALT